MEKNNVDVEVIRAIDYDIANGVWDNMTKHGWEKDDWPTIFSKVMNSNVLIIGSPIG
jgi:multimeric flavodoxin WrbA